MPFTTPRLAGALVGRRLSPTAALVIGAVMPDVPLFLRLDMSHLPTAYESVAGLSDVTASGFRGSRQLEEPLNPVT